MTVNGEKIKNMEQDFSSISIKLVIMENGRKILEKATALIITPMEISTKEIGIVICRTVMELITMQTGISIKDNGSKVANTDKETTSILRKEQSTKVTGEKDAKKALENW